MPQDHITTRGITVVDAAGRPRIIMDGGGEDGFATLTLVSTTGDNIQLQTQPHGTVAITLGDASQHGRIMITQRGIDLRARDGKFAVTIGDFFDDRVDQLIVYQEGQPIWSMPSPDATPNG